MTATVVVSVGLMASGALVATLAAAPAGGAAPTPSFLVFDAAPHAGSAITASGAGCTASGAPTTVLLQVDSPHGDTVAASVVDVYDTATGQWYGQVSVPVTSLPGAGYTVTASCRANGPVFTYAPVTVHVGAATSYMLTLGASAVAPGSTVTVSGADCQRPVGFTGPLSAETILVNDESIPVDVAAVAPKTDGSWTATLTVPDNAKPGVFLVTANCDQYNAGQDYAPQSIWVHGAPLSPAPTVLTYRGVTSGATGSPVTLEAALKTGGVGVAGVPVTLSLGAVSVTATTNLGGVARALAQVPAPGTVHAAAAFAGNGGFAASTTGAVPFTVAAPQTATKLTWVGTSSARQYSPTTVGAKLTTTTGTAVAGRAVTFVNTAYGEAQAAVTNASGVATLSYAFDSIGIAAIVVEYSGANDPTYASSTLSHSVTVGAAFVPTAVACATASKCTTVGASGQSEVTTDDGSSWTWVAPKSSDDLSSVACPSSNFCIAVGASGVVLTSANGGSSWTVKPALSTQNLTVVKCSSATDCVIVGNAGTVFTTTNGGTKWTAGNAGTTQNFDGLSCPTTASCLATANLEGATSTLTSSNGGRTWTTVATSAPYGPGRTQDDLWCTSATNCDESSVNSSLSHTTNGGLTWTSVANLYGATLWCRTASDCLAVSGYGIGTTTDAGAVWNLVYGFYPEGQVADMSCTTKACVAVFSDGSYGDASSYTSTDNGATWKGPVGL
jgi:hypothetical protein